MQVNGKSKFQSLKLLLFFAIVMFLAYLPATSFMFFLKNDAFTGYFPPKFFMSESLHAGYLPLWNPYINFGLPQYGDMSSGFWSPITWLIAGTIGYNAYSFTLEVFLYIFISGGGMYKLCKGLELNTSVCILAGVAYMCSGYMVGHLQHFNWISGAAFLPFCFYYYMRLCDSYSLKDVLKCAIFFYLLISSAHPGIIIGSLYFFTALAISIFLRNKNGIELKKRLILFLKINTSILVAILLLCAGLVAGYLDILPYITRGEKVPLTEVLSQPTSLISWISALLPLAIVKNDNLFQTEISMRNVFFGIIFFLFLLKAIIERKKILHKFFLITGFVFLLLSSGGIFKTFAYNFLPLIAYVRFDGEFVIFSLLCFIPCAAISLDKYFKSDERFYGALTNLFYLLIIFLGFAIVYGAFKIVISKESIFYHLESLSQQKGLINKCKFLIDDFSFYDALLIQGAIQVLFLIHIRIKLRAKQLTGLVRICIIQIVFLTLLNVPYTGVGKTSVAQVNTVLKQSPEGIPIPELVPITNYDTANSSTTSLVGDWSFYSKQPGTKTLAPYPIMLTSTIELFENHQHIFSQPLIFMTAPTTGFKVGRYTANNIDISFEGQQRGNVVVQQNYFKHWYFYSDGQRNSAKKYNQIFIAAPFEKGKNNIRFSFEPTLVRWMMGISTILFICFLIAILFLTFNKSRV